MNKTCLLSLFLLALFAHPVFCQERCDTIILKDGRRIAAEIIRTDREGVLYAPCGAEDEREYLLNQEKIARIQLGHEALPKLNLPPVPKEKPLPPEFSYLRKSSDLGKPKTIIWAGISPGNNLLSNLDLTKNSFFQFGAEIGFRKAPLRLALLMRPVSLNNNNYYENVRKSGINSEIGLVLKKFTLGRLTGNLSKIYWGMGVHIGRQAYQYKDGYPTANQKVIYTWTTIMPRVGCQFTYKMFALDLALPIGYHHSSGKSNSSNSNSYYKSDALTIQPSASLGFRFNQLTDN